MIRFSIIVPVYNAEQYIRKCIDSILAQTFTEFELILVDDGSPDECGKICDEYQKKDSRIKVIHKQNGGQSSARNIALEFANGEYVCFVDSDDYVDENMLMDIDSEIKTNESEVIIFGVKNVKRARIREKIFRSESTEKIKLNLLSGEWENWPCNKCFVRKLFSNKKFPEGMLFEDVFLVPEICLEAKKITVIEKAYYFYNRDNEGSTTNKMNSLKWFDFFLSLKKNRDLCIARNIDRDACERLERLCIKKAKKCAFVHLNDYRLSGKEFQVIKEYLKECLENGKVKDIRDKLWLYLLLNKLWICRIYARFRGY